MVSKIKSNRKIILLSLLAIFILWIITGNLNWETEDRPIKRITETRALYLFGKRKILTLNKNEEIYNVKGKIIEQLFYNGDSCDSKYIYSYTPFDSFEKIMWLTGEDFTPQTIEYYFYDSLRRKQKYIFYDMNKPINLKSIREETTWHYDQNSRIIKTIAKRGYGDHITNSYYNSSGLLTTDSIFFIFPNGVKEFSLHKYFYDKNGFEICTIKIDTAHGGNDTIYTKRNIRGQIVEMKTVKGNGFNPSIYKAVYDENGNKIEYFDDLGDGGRILTSRFVYDHNNRLIKAISPRGIPFILNVCTIYDYEYY